MVQAVVLLGLLPLVLDSISCFSFLVLALLTVFPGASSFPSSMVAPFIATVEALEPFASDVAQFLTSFNDFGFEDKPLPVMI